MELSQQVCSLEPAKRLKELGVKQESLFRWIQDGGRWYLTESLSFQEGYYAYTVAELGEMLPGERHWSDVKTNTGRWRCSEYDIDGLAQDGKSSFIATTEADARAMMLINLLENNPITL